MTAEIADFTLPVASDSDVALFAGLLAYLAATGRIDRDYVRKHTHGLDETLAAAGPLDFPAIAARTSLAPEDLAAFYTLFAETEKVVTVFSQGVNQSVSGTDKVNAIINCHLATGRIGRPGMGPFSVTGQPNAMGGREVGGLANMLAAHMEIENPAHRARVRRFWRSPRIAGKPGLKAVDMFRAVADGRIKALWIMATNPVDSMPDAGMVERALRDCPFLVVSDVARDTDTARHAKVKLPAAAWGEKDGTVTNSERCVSRQRPFLKAPGMAQPDWWILCQVAKRMGFAAAFSYASPAEVFAEHAALSAFENDGERDFDIGAFAGIDRNSFDRIEPFQWPRAEPGAPAETRFFADGAFFHADGKARIVPVHPVPAGEKDTTFPFILNTGRVRDHWHTMTRTGRSVRLSQHLAEPFAEIHPGDARACEIADADIVRVSTARGSILARAYVSSRQSPGSVFVPMHWTDQYASNARIDRLIPSVTDPYSGQPALKHVPMRIERFAAAEYGFAVLRERPPALDCAYWAIARCEGGFRLELAFTEERDWGSFAASLFAAPPEAETLAYRDAATGRHRFACFAGDRLIGSLFLSAEPVSVSRAWACDQLITQHADIRARLAVIAGRPSLGTIDRGAILCSCFGIGTNEIANAVADGCISVTEVGEALGAGTNCGSCRAEISRLIERHGVQAAMPQAEDVEAI